LRTDLARDLNAFRERWREYKFRSDDAWIKTNSEIEPQRLHALGVVSFRWNMSEQLLLAVFTELLNLPKREAQILAHGLGPLDFANRINVLASTRLRSRPKLVKIIHNALEVYDLCRQNRNQVTHFDVQIALGKERAKGFSFARRVRKPDTFPDTVQFDDSLQNIRRIAKEIWRLNVQLKTIFDGVWGRNRRSAFAVWPNERKQRIARLKPLPLLLATQTRSPTLW
jgi:hypothetical protein